MVTSISPPASSHRLLNNSLSFTKRLRARIYIRVSTEDQAREGYSLEAQRRQLENFEDLLFARLGMYSALRLNEIHNLIPKNVVLPERAVSVIGKGNKQYYVPIDHTTLQVIQCYINEKGLDQEARLFSVTPRTMQNRVETYAKKAGIKRIRVTPHTLRHTACSLMLYRKIPVEVVQKIMGHSDISTTMLYFHVVPNIIVRSYYEAFGEGLI